MMAVQYIYHRYIDCYWQLQIQLLSELLISQDAMQTGIILGD